MTEQMKPSGIAAIGEIPTSWEVMRIKDIGTYRNGLTYSPEDIVDKEYGTLVLRASNIQGGKLSFDDNVYVSSLIPKELYAHKGDIIICSRNGSSQLVGKNALVEDNNEQYTFGAFMMVYRCDCPQYMYYVLNSEIFSYYLGTFLTSTINQLTGFNFGNMKIAYCKDPSEQHAIANFLQAKCSKIDGIIADIEKQIETLQKYKKSLITKTVTKGLDKSATMKDSKNKIIGTINSEWEVKKLKYIVATPITDGPHETPILLDDGIPFLSAESVKNGVLDFNYKRGYISEADHRIFCQKIKPQKGDVFVVKSGATTGNVGKVTTDEEFSVWSPLALIRCDNETVLQDFIYYCTLSNYFRQEVELSWSYGTQQNIGMGVLGNLSVVIPPAKEQKLLVEFLNEETKKIDNIINLKLSQLETIQQHKKSLIYEYVTGKKRVTEVN